MIFGLYILTWVLAALCTYAALDLAWTARAHRGPVHGRNGAIAVGFAAVLSVALGAWLPLGATSCVLLGGGLGAATFALLPVLGLESRPAWARRPERTGRRRQS